MVKIACLALLLAGIIGWAIRDDATQAPAGPRPVQSTNPAFLQKVSDNAGQRQKLKSAYPETWNNLARQTTRDLATCVVTEVAPGVLKAECR